jgi:hypothetical protein
MCSLLLHHIMTLVTVRGSKAQAAETASPVISAVPSEPPLKEVEKPTHSVVKRSPVGRVAS